MHFGIHHLVKKHKSNRAVKIFDELIYVAAFFGPVMLVPQLLKIWSEKSAAGVSIVTWAGSLAGAVFWLIYGLIHKEKAIIVANLTLGILALLIVISIMIYP